MKTGKLTEAVWNRSVRKQLHTRQSDVLFGAAFGGDFAAVTLGADEAVVLSIDPITYTCANAGKFAVIAGLNDVAAAGAAPVGILVSLLLPTTADEMQLREIIKEMELICESAGAEIVGEHIEATRAVKTPLVTVTGVGKVKKDTLRNPSHAEPGMDILVVNWVGLEGTLILVREKEEELRTRYAQPFLDRTMGLELYLPVWKEAQAAAKSGVAAMHNVSEGGIYGALWELAQSSGIGLEVDLKKIPIRQETVEICEFFDLNPYKLISGGCMLMAAEDGRTVIRAIEQAGGRAVLIGKATEGNDRVLIRDGERRFLETVQTDEIRKIMK